MPSTKQDKEFAEEMKDEAIIKDSALDTAIDWISKNLNPGDVFSESDLIDWAESNGFVLKGDDVEK